MKNLQNMTRFLLAGLLLVTISGMVSQAQASVGLGATRVIYPGGSKQVQLPVTNNDAKKTFLIQSWIENEEGKKDGRFVITPPLFSMKGKKENTLRIIDATNNQLPKDRESLFWLNVKAIPSMDKEQANKSQNTLQLAIVSRIKLYYRPANLELAPEHAAEKLTFSRAGSSLTLNNPTPYYLTVTELSAGGRPLDNTLVPPFGSASVKIPSDAGNEIKFRTINDFGALTDPMKILIR